MIRPASPEDAYSIARIHVDAWRAAYAGIVPQAHLDSLSVEDRTERWDKSIRAAKLHTQVFDLAGRVAGWIVFGGDRDNEGIHEIYALYVAPSHWRAGMGRALLIEAERILGDERCADIALWVLKDNHRSIAFYRSLGYEKDGAEKQVEIGGNSLHNLRMRKKA